MSIIAIMGDRGAGKTCFLTHLLTEDYESGRKIISNYHLNFDHEYMTLNQISELPESIKDATVAIDELHIGADSRRALSNSNMGITKLATQLRKRGCVLYYTTQRFNLIDKRLRDQTDLVVAIEPGKVPNTFDATIMDRWTGETMGRKLLHGPDCWDLYDTNEIIDVE